jgi:hypothetical protein
MVHLPTRILTGQTCIHTSSCFFFFSKNQEKSMRLFCLSLLASLALADNASTPIDVASATIPQPSMEILKEEPRATTTQPEAPKAPTSPAKPEIPKAPATPSYTDMFCKDGNVERKEVREMAKKDWLSYVAAFKLLATNGVLASFINIHLSKFI